MTYVPSSSTLPPRMPGAAKPPFWTKGKLFLVGMVFLAIVAAANNRPTPQAESARVAVAEPVETSPPIGDGNAAKLDNIVGSAAYLILYEANCDGVVPPRTRRVINEVIDQVGDDRMKLRLLSLNENRTRIGTGQFCALVRKVYGNLL